MTKRLIYTFLFSTLALNICGQINPYLERSDKSYNAVILNYIPTGQPATDIKDIIMATGRYDFKENETSILFQHKEWVAGDKIWPNEIFIKTESGIVKSCGLSYYKLPMTDETITNAILTDIKSIVQEDYIMKEGDDDINYIFAASNIVVTFPFHKNEIFVFFLPKT